MKLGRIIEAVPKTEVMKPLHGFSVTGFGRRTRSLGRGGRRGGLRRLVVLDRVVEDRDAIVFAACGVSLKGAMWSRIWGVTAKGT